MGLCSLGVNTTSRVILFNGVCLSSRSYWENLLRCSVLGFCNPWLTSIPTPAHQAQSECLLNLDEGKAHIYLLSFWDTLIKGTAAVLSPVFSRYPGERGPRFAFFRQVRSHHPSLLTFRSWESCKAAAPSSSGQVDRSCVALGPFTGRTTQGLDIKRTIVHTGPSRELLWAPSITRSTSDKGRMLVICMTH